MVYNPPGNQAKELEMTLQVTRNTIIVGDFNAPHTDWGYKRTEVGKILAELIYSNAVLLLEDEDEENRDTPNCKLCDSGKAQDRTHLFVDSLPDNLSRQEKEAIIYCIARNKEWLRDRPWSLHKKKNLNANNPQFFA
jgi:Endonuclease-reverse transcriptase